MLFRDIVDRHAVSNTAVLKQFLKRILNTVSNKLSVHKLYNELKSQGLAISKNAVYEFLDYAIDCFLLFTIHAYEHSPAKQQMRTRKVYAADNGLINAVTYRFSEDRGALLENAVFLHLNRNERAVYYLNDQDQTLLEVDVGGQIASARRTSRTDCYRCECHFSLT
jgi:predicted AAA+ superfamily ATPase